MSGSLEDQGNEMRDQWFWRVRDNAVMPGYPMQIAYFWRGLPPKIDAVYENSEGKFVFFKGCPPWPGLMLPGSQISETARDKRPPEAHLGLAAGGNRFWVFKDTTLQPSYPQDISRFGSGMTAQSIETAVWWEDVAKTYFFKGDRYWRYNEEMGTMDPGYPKPITVWKGVPDSPQGAFVDKAKDWQETETVAQSGVAEVERSVGSGLRRGHSHWMGQVTWQGCGDWFLEEDRGKEYWKFNNQKLRVEPGYPRSILKDFMGCDGLIDPDREWRPPEEDVDIVIKLDNTAGTVKAVAIVIPCILALCLLVLVYTIFQFKRMGTSRHILYCKRSMQEWV
ncbi:hypothetical protein JZ751_010294 [Albula glossodonta]|uniref:Peptidase M10A matrix metallopeptidase C-terminal domain-containing protein n=1 Tax=Albula glossodonta TaxID=121402 RepID=A0A8T2N0Y1_9TELE|nr:hypothetical protein JZ751_010294 [Albula glossodonta]